MLRLQPFALALALVAGSAFAQTVPTKVTFTGRIVDSGAPVTGNRDFVFKLFPTVVGGSEVWLETRNSVAVVDGAVNLDLGASTPLTPAILDGQTLYLEVTVGTQVLSPRTPVLSVPYAVRSSVAAQVGSLTAAQIQQRVNSACGAGAAIQSINADGTVTCQAVGANDAGVTTITNITAGSGLLGGGSTGNVNLSANFGGSGSATTVSRSDHNHTGTYLPLGPVLACTGTDKVVSIAANGSVVCAVDTSNTYGVLTNGGLALNGSNQFSLAICPTPGHFYKMAGGVWTCSPDADTAPTGNAPIAVLSNVVSLAPCATPGHVYKMAGGVWTCSPDADSAPTGNAPISVTGNAVSLTTCTNAGEILKMVGGVWRCSSDDNGVTAVNAAGPLSSTGGTTPTISLAGVVPVGNGGTGAALTATGGTGQVVKQLMPGGPFSVGALTASELPPLPPTVQNWSTQPGCPVGQALRGIGADGTPTCASMPVVPVWGTVYTGTCGSGTCTITVPGTWAHGSSAGTVTVTHPSTGNYGVTFPWINLGVPQVSLYGGSNGVCRIASWNSNPVTAFVTCTTLTGTAFDTAFNVTVHGS